MKTIKTLIEIPSKYKWMAQDEDGRIYGYETEPEAGEWSTGNYNHVGLGGGKPNPNWKNTLRRIEEYEDVTEAL